MAMIEGIFREAFFLFNRMAPYLLFGYFFAGVLHVFLSTETVGRHLGEKSFLSVIKASLFGIPLPLCSCSVIPAAMSLRKEGASKGAVLSFLISTPTTGIDSIFATYSLLGGLFTAYRVAASFVAGVFSGVMANLLLKDNAPPAEAPAEKCGLCRGDRQKVPVAFSGAAIGLKVREVLEYAFRDLLRDTGPPLLAGVFIGGAITFFMPARFIEAYLGSGIVSMLIMLAVGIPMYVCANASIPIAVSLMLKGLSPGAAFVFLVAGPATNIATMAVVAKNMGKGVLAVYIASISLSAVAMGWGLNVLWGYFFDGPLHHMAHAHGKMTLPVWAADISSILIFLLIAMDLIRRVLPSKGSRG